METKPPIVYIVDDDDGVRTSLSWLLGSVKIQSKCLTSAKELLDAYDPEIPACLVLDVRMPEVGGFELQDILKKQGAALPIIFMSGHGDIPMSVRAMQNGAIDFVEKPYNSQYMLDRIQTALRIAVEQHQMMRRKQMLQSKLALLTTREKEVMQGVIEGKSSKEIARELNISVKTVDVHRASVKEKLGMPNTATLVRELLAMSAFS